MVRLNGPDGNPAADPIGLNIVPTKDMGPRPSGPLAWQFENVKLLEPGQYRVAIGDSAEMLMELPFEVSERAKE